VPLSVTKKVAPMDVLILGGTGFLGRHLVEVAVGNGHRVTLFNRGIKAPGLFPELETIEGDREVDLTALSGRGSPSGSCPSRSGTYSSGTAPGRWERSRPLA